LEEGLTTVVQLFFRVLLLGFFICQLFLLAMLVIGLHSLNLNHKTRKLEKVKLVENFIFASAILRSFLNLGKNFVDELVVSVVQDINEVCLNNRNQLSVTILHGSLIDNLLLSLDLVLFCLFTD